MPVVEQQRRKQTFEVADRAVLASNQTLQEGITFAGGVDMVVFVDPKQSIVQIQQAAFRALCMEGNLPHGIV
eukprot:CAMPEP_0197846338 /NCGR_PEP_ID=MMETSP1438-20131217/3095_1 /TAXON_ID=1461541 /ORGANISM="Pterosperma sp., Strain CCMP1384" /LENGTH=71 /DNA_ID=CAMNT_0043457941 /DNA_START=38 /DNA_END=249 /DNA_ORIENTATION=+